VPPHITHLLHLIILLLAPPTLQQVPSIRHQAPSTHPRVQHTPRLPLAIALHHLHIHLLCQVTPPPLPPILQHLPHTRVMTELQVCKLNVIVGRGIHSIQSSCFLLNKTATEEINRSVYIEITVNTRYF
jgi:hypothetical protein